VTAISVAISTTATESFESVVHTTPCTTTFDKTCVERHDKGCRLRKVTLEAWANYCFSDVYRMSGLNSIYSSITRVTCSMA